MFINRILFFVVLVMSPSAFAGQMTLSVQDPSKEHFTLLIQTSYASHKIEDPTGELSFLTYTMFLFYPLAEQVYLKQENKEVVLQRTMNGWMQEKPILKALLEKIRSNNTDAHIQKTVSNALAQPMFQEGQIPKYKDIEKSLLPVNDAIRLWIGSNKQLKVHAIHAKALDVYDGHIVTKAMSKQRDKLVLQRK